MKSTIVNMLNSTDQLRRAFEVALWAMPAADSFAAREGVKRELHSKPNDVAINTKPLIEAFLEPKAILERQPVEQ